MKYRDLISIKLSLFNQSVRNTLVTFDLPGSMKSNDLRSKMYYLKKATEKNKDDF